MLNSRPVYFLPSRCEVSAAFSYFLRKLPFFSELRAEVQR